MNLLHTLVATLIENFPTVLGILSACFHLGVTLSCLAAALGITSWAYSFLRGSLRRV